MILGRQIYDISDARTFNNERAVRKVVTVYIDGGLDSSRDSNLQSLGSLSHDSSPFLQENSWRSPSCYDHETDRSADKSKFGGQRSTLHNVLNDVKRGHQGPGIQMAEPPSI
jgi:hypothetical protein